MLDWYKNDRNNKLQYNFITLTRLNQPESRVLEDFPCINFWKFTENKIFYRDCDALLNISFYLKCIKTIELRQYIIETHQQKNYIGWDVGKYMAILVSQP